jgi:hypothetical protein
VLGNFERSLNLYHAARIGHQKETGSIEATAAQLRMLLALDFVPEEWRTRFRQEFAAYLKG